MVTVFFIEHTSTTKFLSHHPSHSCWNRLFFFLSNFLSAVTLSRRWAIIGSLFPRSPRVSARPRQREQLMRHIPCWSGSWISDDFLSGSRFQIPPLESLHEGCEKMQIWGGEKCRRHCRVTNVLIWISLRLHRFNGVKLTIISSRRPSVCQRHPENDFIYTPRKGPWKKKNKKILGGRMEPSKWTKDRDWLLSTGLKNSTGAGSQQFLWVQVCHDIQHCFWKHNNLILSSPRTVLLLLLLFVFQCVQQRT